MLAEVSKSCSLCYCEIFLSGPLAEVSDLSSVPTPTFLVVSELARAGRGWTRYGWPEGLMSFRNTGYLSRPPSLPLHNPTAFEPEPAVPVLLTLGSCVAAWRSQAGVEISCFRRQSLKVTAPLPPPDTDTAAVCRTPRGKPRLLSVFHHAL